MDSYESSVNGTDRAPGNGTSRISSIGENFISQWSVPTFNSVILFLFTVARGFMQIIAWCLHMPDVYVVHYQGYIVHIEYLGQRSNAAIS